MGIDLSIASYAKMEAFSLIAGAVVKINLRIKCWFLIDLTIKLMMIIKLLLDVWTLSSVIFSRVVK